MLCLSELRGLGGIVESLTKLGVRPVEAGAASVRESAELAESLSTAFLLMLETLSPVERAAFLLHEVFGYSHREVGEMVERSEDACPAEQPPDIDRDFSSSIELGFSGVDRSRYLITAFQVH